MILFIKPIPTKVANHILRGFLCGLEKAVRWPADEDSILATLQLRFKTIRSSDPTHTAFGSPLSPT